MRYKFYGRNEKYAQKCSVEVDLRDVKLWSGFGWPFSGETADRDQMGNYQLTSEHPVGAVDCYFCNCR
jgi:hypothetical protein